MDQNQFTESGNSPPRRRENNPPLSPPSLRPNKKMKDPIASLVMNKRRLPAILRSDVPLLRLENTLIQHLVATRTKLWGVLHADVGKTIKYDGRPAVILNVHKSIRQIGLDEYKSIWLSRRIANKREFKNLHIKRQFASGIRRLFTQPFWKGEPPPTHNLDGQPLEVIPHDVFAGIFTIEENTKRFLRSIGAGRLLIKTAKETLLMSTATRLVNLKKYLHDLVVTKKKEITQNLTIEALRLSQMKENRLNAIYDLVFEERPLEETAAHRNIDPESLQRTYWRIQNEINTEVEKQFNEWLKLNPETASAYEELENLRHVQFVVTAAKSTAQDRR